MPLWIAFCNEMDCDLCDVELTSKSINTAPMNNIRHDSSKVDVMCHRKVTSISRYSISTTALRRSKRFDYIGRVKSHHWWIEARCKETNADSEEELYCRLSKVPTEANQNLIVLPGRLADLDIEDTIAPKSEAEVSLNSKSKTGNLQGATMLMREDTYGRPSHTSSLLQSSMDHVQPNRSELNRRAERADRSQASHIRRRRGAFHALSSYQRKPSLKSLNVEKSTSFHQGTTRNEDAPSVRQQHGGKHRDVYSPDLKKKPRIPRDRLLYEEDEEEWYDQEVERPPRQQIKHHRSDLNSWARKDHFPDDSPNQSIDNRLTASRKTSTWFKKLAVGRKSAPPHEKAGSRGRVEWN
jgi:hypothetical protein